MEDGIIFLRHETLPSCLQRRLLEIEYDAVGFFYTSILGDGIKVSYYNLLPKEPSSLVKFNTIDVSLAEIQRNPVVVYIKLLYINSSKLRDIISNTQEINSTIGDCLSKLNHPVIKLFEEIRETFVSITEKIIKSEKATPMIPEKIPAAMVSTIATEYSEPSPKLFSLVKTFRDQLESGPGILDINSLIYEVNKFSSKQIPYLPGDETRECILSVKPIETSIKLRLNSGKKIYLNDDLDNLTTDELKECLSILDKSSKPSLSYKVSLAKRLGLAK